MSNEEELKPTDAEGAIEEGSVDATDGVAAPQAEPAQSADAVAPEENSGERDGEEEGGKTQDKADELDDGGAPDASMAAQAEKPKKEKKERAKREGKGMSKLFKLIYYPAIAVFALIMMIFSVIDGVYGYKPKAYNADYYKAVQEHITKLDNGVKSAMSDSGTKSARDYIVSTLESAGFANVDESKTGEDSDDEITTVTEWGELYGGYAPTVTLMTSVPSVKLQNAMGTDGYLVGHTVTNVIAALPSKGTRDNRNLSAEDRKEVGAVVITVRYDTRPDSAGAADNSAFVAVALQSLVEYVNSNVDFERDLIVVFTEELDESFGSNVFFYSFKGLDDVVSRVDMGINLDAYGNAGTLALTDVSGAGLDYINAYTKISGTTFNSSIVPDSIPSELKINGAVAAFGDIPALQVAVLGGLDAAASLTDTSANIAGNIIYQQSDLFKNYVDAFARSAKKAVSSESGKDLTVFSYFDAGTVAYNEVAAYVIGAIILALIAGAITMVVIKKTFSIKKLLLALGVEALTVVSTLVAMFAAYFLVTLMLTGFGAIPIHAITQVRYFNAGIFIAAMVISLASAFGFTTLYKKLLKVTSSDVVRGTALAFGLVGAIMSFAAPSYSYLTAWAGLLMVATLLTTACLNGKLKERFGFGFDRLFIYVVPLVLCMPFMLSGLSMMTELLPLYMLPVTMMLFTAMLGVAVPYLDRTRVVFDRVAKKLPPRTQRVERVVTEKVEDRAKKGKFTERTVKRIEKEKVAISYKNYFGISLIAVVGIVIALFSGGFGMAFGQTITKPQTYRNAIYNDSLVYEWELGASGTATQRIIVDDLVAYKYIRYAVNDLKWDAANERYYKTVYYSTDAVVGSQPTITRNESKYTVNTFDGSYSNVTLTIPSASSVTKITVTRKADNKQYEYSFSRESEIVLRMPYGFGNFDMDIEGGNPSTIQYEEHREVLPDSTGNQLGNVDEWNAVLNEYRDMDLVDTLRGGIVVKRTFAL